MKNNHYSFRREELPDFSQVYNFTTRHNLIYTVYFNTSDYDQWLDDFPYLLQNGYALGFFPLFTPPDSKKQLDPLIYSTLCKIIDDFFVLMGADCVLLYHCDHSDSKQAYRNKLFSHWYNCTPLSSVIERYSLEVSIAGDEIPMSYYLGYLTPKNNPNLPVLKAEFEDLAFHILEPKHPNPTI